MLSNFAVCLRLLFSDVYLRVIPANRLMTDVIPYTRDVYSEFRNRSAVRGTSGVTNFVNYETFQYITPAVTPGWTEQIVPAEPERVKRGSVSPGPGWYARATGLAPPNN